jgi:hypothetical protein
MLLLLHSRLHGQLKQGSSRVTRQYLSTSYSSSKMLKRRRDCSMKTRMCALSSTSSTATLTAASSSTTAVAVAVTVAAVAMSSSSSSSLKSSSKNSLRNSLRSRMDRSLQEGTFFLQGRILTFSLCPACQTMVMRCVVSVAPIFCNYAEFRILCAQVFACRCLYV